MNDYIMVVDLESSEKAFPIARRFLNLASRVFYIQHTDKVREIKKNGNDSDYTTILPEFRLIFLHNKYKNVLPKEAKYRCLINYSGGEGHFSKKNAHWEYWLNRKINNENDMPSVTETRQLLEWAIECKEEDMPAILLPPQGTSGLIALSILCQGYLAVHANCKEQDKDWKDQDISIALEQMSWNTVDKSLIPSSLGEKEKIKKVRDPGWWWIVFETDIEDRKSLLAAIQKEWNASSDKEISKELEDLIRLIVEDNEVKPAKMVAKAYLALVEKLGV
jgi:hypothetical protein